MAAMYKCINCKNNIKKIRVHCAECDNFDLCLDCLTIGAEIGAHKKHHGYELLDNGSEESTTSRDTEAWTASEELLLTEAIKLFGYGNWHDISNHIKTKSREQAKENYTNRFIDGTISRLSWPKPQNETMPDNANGGGGDVGGGGGGGGGVGGGVGGDGVADLPENSSFVLATPADDQHSVQLAYMTKRVRFDAEQLAASNLKTSNGKDFDFETELKLAHDNIYERRLQEREQCKRVIREYQLVDEFLNNLNNATTEPEIEINQIAAMRFRKKFRIFAKFYNYKNYNQILNSLKREMELRNRLVELNFYHSKGLKKMADCAEFKQQAAFIMKSLIVPLNRTVKNCVPAQTMESFRKPEYSWTPLRDNIEKNEVVEVDFNNDQNEDEVPV